MVVQFLHAALPVSNKPLTVTAVPLTTIDSEFKRPLARGKILYINNKHTSLPGRKARVKDPQHPKIRVNKLTD